MSVTALTAAYHNKGSLSKESPGKWSAMLWIVPVFAATFFAKFAIPPFGAQGISITLPILLAVTMLGGLTCQFVFSTQRLIWAAIALASLGIMQLLKNDPFWVSSLVLLFALNVPFVFRLRTPPRDIFSVLNCFLWVCGICAIGGILQFALQPFIDSKILFPIDNFVPQSFLVQNFNEQAPLEYGAKLLRANGVFMMEPSYLSQLLAVAVVAEVATRNRWWLLLLFLAGMIVSYSGTGLMILAVCVPVTVITQRRWGFLAIMLAAVALLILLSQFLYLDSFLSRVSEFNSTGSSGFARFVGGFYLFDQYLWQHPLRAAFGLGAGNFKDYVPMAHYPVVEMPLFKMVLEFGLFGALLYFCFLIACLSSSNLPGAVAVAIAMTFLLNGLYVPFSHAISISLLMWTSSPLQSVAKKKGRMPIPMLQPATENS